MSRYGVTQKKWQKISKIQEKAIKIVYKRKFISILWNIKFEKPIS